MHTYRVTIDIAHVTWRWMFYGYVEIGRWPWVVVVFVLIKTTLQAECFSNSCHYKRLDFVCHNKIK